MHLSTSKLHLTKLISLVCLIVTLLTLVISTITQPLAALPGDMTWQKASGITGDSMDWAGAASNADGTKMFAVEKYSNNWNGGYIHSSIDSGQTWTKLESAGSRNWSSITSSADGTKLVAATEGGYI